MEDNVVIMGVAIFVLIIAILLFYLSVRREKKKRMKTNFVRNVADGNGEFSAFIHQCLSKKNKDKFLFVLRIAELDRINEEFDEEQREYLMKQMLKRCLQAFNRQVIISQNDKKDFYLLNKRTVLTSEAKELCEMLIVEAKRPMVLADAYRKQLSVNICAVNMENVKDIDVLKSQIDASLLKLSETKENSYEFIDAEINAKDIQHFEFYKLLQNSVEHSAVELKFCPVVEIETKKIVRLDCMPIFTVDGKKVDQNKFAKVLVQSPEMCSKELKLVYLEVLKQRKSWDIDFETTDYEVGVEVYQQQLSNQNLFDDLRQTSRMFSSNNNKQIFEIEDNRENDLSKCTKILDLLAKMSYKLFIKNFSIAETTLELIGKDYISGMELTVYELSKAAEDPIKKLILNMMMTCCEEGQKSIIATDVNSKDDLEAVKALGIRFAKGKYIGEYQEVASFKKLKIDEFNENVQVEQESEQTEQESDLQEPDKKEKNKKDKKKKSVEQDSENK